MKNSIRDFLLRLSFNCTRLVICTTIYIAPILCIYLYNDEKDFFKIFFNINMFANIIFMGVAIIFSNFISLKIFRKIEKRIYPDK